MTEPTRAPTGLAVKLRLVGLGVAAGAVAALAVTASAKKNDASVVTNFRRLLQFRPGGIFPHFFNVPVIA